MLVIKLFTHCVVKEKLFGDVGPRNSAHNSVTLYDHYQKHKNFTETKDSGFWYLGIQLGSEMFNNMQNVPFKIRKLVTPVEKITIRRTSLNLCMLYLALATTFKIDDHKLSRIITTIGMEWI